MIRAVIFDLDGTVLDNEDDWDAAFMEVARRHDVAEPKLKLPNGWWHEPGLGLEQNWWKILRDPILAKKLAGETAESYKVLSKEKNLRLREGSAELVQRVKDQGMMTALCTGSTWNVVEYELEQLGLYLAFDVTTTGEEVVMPKPDPEIYLLTAQKLNLEPEECLVVEDAVAGVRAAVEAGMQAVGLISDYAPEEMLRAAGAKEVIMDFNSYRL
jgi:HAD superfamily hydrolase (TIGR01509 family)